MLLYLFYDLMDFFNPKTVVIDGVIFRFHCRFTAYVILMFCMYSNSSLIFGEPIVCLDNYGYELEQAFTDLCWMKNKYTMPESALRTTTDENYTAGKRHHGYYQWVPVVLCIQGILCCLPRYFWRMCEKRYIEELSFLINYNTDDREFHEGSKEQVIHYFLARTELNVHSAYSRFYMFCEILCLVNVFGQIFFMNSFLDGEFLTYGLDVFYYLYEEQENRFDPMIYVFPTSVKCDYYKIGPSGTMMNLDALCFLPFNIVNQKIYTILWFWFLILGVMVSLQILFRMVLNNCLFLRVLLLKTITNDISTASIICQWANLGDFWMIVRLSNNVNKLDIKDILKVMANAIQDANAFDSFKVKESKDKFNKLKQS